MLARRFDVVVNPVLYQRARKCLRPLEVICRHYLAGSGWRRYAGGDAPAENLDLNLNILEEEIENFQSHILRFQLSSKNSIVTR